MTCISPYRILEYAFAILPLDIVVYHIIPHVARNWLFVNRFWRDIAFSNLLSDDRIDPTHTENDPIRWAVQAGYDKVVALLLADSRVNHALLNDNQCVTKLIEMAATVGHDKIVARLLAIPRVDFTAGYNVALLMATKEGHDKVVALLLTSPYTVNPATIEDSNFTLIEWGAMKGHDKVVATLLADPRIDPSVADNGAIQMAASGGYDKVVALLLADPRVDPTAENNAAIEMAVAYDHPNVFHQLLDDPRVNDTVDLSILHHIYKNAT